MNTEITKQAQSDDIDLVELIKALWDKKWWIVLSTFVCTAVAGIYAFTAKEQWTSKAEITSPTIVDASSYVSIRSEYARILGTEFNTETFLNSLYNKFKKLSFSLNKRETFLENSEVYKQLSQGLDESGKRQILNKLARENINIIIPDPKKEPNAIGIKFAFSAEKPEIAQSSLNEFIKYTNHEAFQLDLGEFIVTANEKISDLKFEYEQIQKDLDIQKTIQLENLNKALLTAEKAGIKEYSKYLDNAASTVVVQNVTSSDTKIPLSDSKLSDGVYVFMLGEKYLKAQIDAANEKDIIYPLRYYQITEQIKELEHVLEKAKVVKANTFSYVSEEDYPIVKDKPRKGFIIIIGFILGSIISSLGVIILSLIKP